MPQIQVLTFKMTKCLQDDRFLYIRARHHSRISATNITGNLHQIESVMTDAMDITVVKGEENTGRRRMRIVDGSTAARCVKEAKKRHGAC